MSPDDCSAVDAKPAEGGEGSKRTKYSELVAGSFGLGSVLLTDGSIMDPC